MASLTQRTWVWTNWEILKGSEAWRSSVHGVSKNRTKLSDWTNNNIQTIYKQTTIQTIYTCINIPTVCIPYSRTWLTVSVVSNFIWLCFIQCCLLYLAPGAHFLMSLNVYLCLVYFSFMPMISLLLKILLLQKGMKMNIDFPLGYKHCSIFPGRNFIFKVFCSIIRW